MGHIMPLFGITSFPGPLEITVKTSFRLRQDFLLIDASKIITCRNIGEKITQNNDTRTKNSKYDQVAPSGVQN